MRLLTFLPFIVISLSMVSPIQAQEAVPSPAAESGMARVEIVLPRADALTKVGDAIEVTLQGVDLPPGARLKAGGGVKEGFKVLENGRVAVLRPGQVQLPSLPVVDAEGRVVAETDPFVLNADSALKEQGQPGKTPEPEPAAGPQSLGVPAVLLILAGVFLVGVLAYLILRLSRYLRRKFPGKAKLPELPESPDVIALKRLQRLESERWYEKGQHKRHFFEISETLKGYLSDRFEIDARESTTSELMSLLRDLQGRNVISSDDLQLLQGCFSVLDLVKFTEYQPEASESVAQLEEARKIVHRTRPAPTILPAVSIAAREGGPSL